MERIACASTGVKSTLTHPLIHDLVEESMRLEALIAICLYSSTLGCGLKFSIPGTHGLVHTSIDLLYPRRKHAPFTTNFLASSIALLVGELAFKGSEVIQPLQTLYFVQSTFMHMLCLPEATIQASLARSVEFISFAFFKTKSPLFFGLTYLSHAVQAMNLLFLSLGFHQNLLKKASILLQFLASTLNADKV